MLQSGGGNPHYGAVHLDRSVDDDGVNGVNLIDALSNQ
jgi:hypothetical protein